MPDSQLFLLGATSMASLAASLFFLRFWRETQDRFFALFSLAFLILAINWICLAIIQPTSETRHLFYLFRLASFLIIIWAIIDKNRASSRS